MINVKCSENFFCIISLFLSLYLITRLKFFLIPMTLEGISTRESTDGKIVDTLACSSIQFTAIHSGEGFLVEERHNLSGQVGFCLWKGGWRISKWKNAQWRMNDETEKYLSAKNSGKNAEGWIDVQRGWGDLSWVFLPFSLGLSFVKNLWNMEPFNYGNAFMNVFKNFE